MAKRNRHKSKQTIREVIEELDVPKEVKHSSLGSGKMRETNISLELREFPICWGLPFDEVMFSAFFENFMALDRMPWDYLATTRSTYLPEARNTIHNLFLNELGGTHLLMLDSDVMPPPGIVGSLLAHDKDMVGGWYVKKEMFKYKDVDGNEGFIQRPVVYDFERSTDEKDLYKQHMRKGSGLQKVAAAGAGCWLMSRKVAEAIGESPYDMERGGEDMVLCKKVSDAGFEMFIDWDINCAHLGVAAY